MNAGKQVTFKLEADGSGYPPDSYERVWTKPLENGNLLVDNIPFYVLGISSGDEIEAREIDGQLCFHRLVRPSGNSTFRLLLTDPSNSAIVRRELIKLGCESEFNQLVGILAVEVPEHVNIAPFLEYISSSQKNGEIDVEEGALRHPIT